MKITHIRSRVEDFQLTRPYTITFRSIDDVQMSFVELDTDAGQAWGSFTSGELGDGTGGGVTLSPDSLPIWCASLE